MLHRTSATCHLMSILNRSLTFRGEFGLNSKHMTATRNFREECKLRQFIYFLFDLKKCTLPRFTKGNNDVKYG